MMRSGAAMEPKALQRLTAVVAGDDVEVSVSMVCREDPDVRIILDEQYSPGRALAGRGS